MRRKPKDGGLRVLDKGRLLSAFWKSQSKSQRIRRAPLKALKIPKLLWARKSISHFPDRKWTFNKSTAEMINFC